ncbi:MAG: DUF3828 domain-containing protein [Bacteroidales bacterium]|nr:DUF3828 domain-containing protein [Bacteroidales bacterium]
MKKSLIVAFLAMAIAVYVSCTGRQTTTTLTTEEEVAEAVNAIYNHVFTCYGEGNDSSEVFNRRYLTKEYLNYFDSVALYDSLYNQGEIGYWDYDRWVMAQDWDHPTFKIDNVTVSDSFTGWYWADIIITNLGQVTIMHLLMMQEDGCWKIGEVLNDNWELRSELDRMIMYCLDLKKLKEGK